MYLLRGFFEDANQPLHIAKKAWPFAMTSEGDPSRSDMYTTRLLRRTEVASIDRRLQQVALD